MQITFLQRDIPIIQGEGVPTAAACFQSKLLWKVTCVLPAGTWGPSPRSCVWLTFVASMASASAASFCGERAWLVWPKLVLCRPSSSQPSASSEPWPPGWWCFRSSLARHSRRESNWNNMSNMNKILCNWTMVEGQYKCKTYKLSDGWIYTIDSAKYQTELTT